MTHRRIILVIAIGLLGLTLPACEGVKPARDQPPVSRRGPRPRAAAPRPAHPHWLQVSDLFGKTPLAGRPMKKFRWSRDGRWLYYLRPSEEDARVLDLWRLDVPSGRAEALLTAKALLAKGRAELTEAQKAERERRRVRNLGITSYVLDRGNTGLLVPLSGYLYYLDLRTRAVKRVFPKPGGELDPRFAPDGRSLSFVRGGNLYLRNLATGVERALTRDGGGTRTNGLAEFVAQEELDRFRGYWWSPDGRYIAFAQVDESPVHRIQRYRISAKGVTVVAQRYPRAGTPNARVRLGVVGVQTGAVRWLTFPPAEDRYLARVRWLEGTGPAQVAVQWLRRDQRRLRLQLADPQTGAVTDVLEEKDPRYLNLHRDLRPLSDGVRFLWSSERTGTRQLELRTWPASVTGKKAVGWDASGSRVRPLQQRTPQALSRAPRYIHEVVGVDAKGGWVYATVPLHRGLELHLYRFALSGHAPPKRLTREPGWHDIEMNRTATHYVDRFSSLDTPPRVTLHDATGKRLRVLDANPPTRWRTFDRAATEFVTIRAADDTPLNGLLLRPPGFDPRHRYPAVVYVYGGPHGHSVARQWRRMNPWHHYLAQRGFVVLLVDGRGTGYRGKTFEAKLWQKFGVVDVADVATAARWLSRQPGIDPNRLGLWGWSYGGYLTAMTLLQTGTLFRAGVAVAPVTDWRLYDTAYTERYLGDPKTHPQAYARSNPVRLAAKLRTHLLVIHGMADDNVLLQNTLLLSKALQDAGRLFDMMLYPGKAHSIKGTRTRRHLLSTLLDTFELYLKPEAAPRPCSPQGSSTRP